MSELLPEPVEEPWRQAGFEREPDFIKASDDGSVKWFYLVELGGADVKGTYKIDKEVKGGKVYA